jgi:hypothetical protein
MTAEIAILNTYGVALAADSAVTLNIGGKEKKIYNSANKIFMLSKFYPIGIMIFNNANFMGVEWEIIIKEYRRTMHNSKQYDDLFRYADDFLKYLGNIEYITIEQQLDYLKYVSVAEYKKLLNLFLAKLKETFKDENNIPQQKINMIFNLTIDNILDQQSKMPHNKKQIDMDFINTNKNILEDAINIVFKNYKISKKRFNDLINILLKDIQLGNRISNYTGVVIAGFGKKDIFPSIFMCNIYGKLGKSIIYSQTSRQNIDFNNRALIIPYAQTEMVHSFMEGIDPVFEKTIKEQLNIVLDKVIELVGEDNRKKLIDVNKLFSKAISDFKMTVYVKPIMNIVSSLQKSDLAEMAESLVNLTSFKRHVSSEAETVGGPTDVAIITKGDGFIWIKRKHYFDIKLNRHFPENYFRGEGNE